MKKLLLIDDDVDFIEMNKSVLQSEYQVFTAHNSKEGLNRIKDQKPDLVVLDVMMDTDWEGLEAVGQLRKASQDSELPIILLTSFADNYSTQWDESGPDREILKVDAYMKKPVSPAELKSKVHELIG